MKQVDLLIKNAGELITARCRTRQSKTKKQLQDLGIIKNGAVAVKAGRIVKVGSSKALSNLCARKTIDAQGKVVMPGFVDCHTHLVFAGSREHEFAQKLKGVDYLTILKRGGGIHDTVRQTRQMLLFHPKQLLVKSIRKLNKALSYGTTAIEIKSGYGLDYITEMASLIHINQLKISSKLDIVPTFLGAHAIPSEFKTNRQGYIGLVLSMIEAVQSEGLAEYCDVFVEKGAFTAKEAERILVKAKACGLKLKLHAGEFNDIGGVELGVKIKATSIDHLEHISARGIKMMAKTKTVGVLMPGVPFHLMTGVYAPARKLIQAGVPIALATDYNPGSSPTLSMPMIMALACREMRMSPAEAINAATINAAFALDRADEIGSLEPGKKADMLILNIRHHQQLPYWFGINPVERVVKHGRIVK